MLDTGQAWKRPSFIHGALSFPLGSTALASAAAIDGQPWHPGRRANTVGMEDNNTAPPTNTRVIAMVAENRRWFAPALLPAAEGGRACLP